MSFAIKNETFISFTSDLLPKVRKWLETGSPDYKPYKRMELKM